MSEILDVVEAEIKEEDTKNSNEVSKKDNTRCSSCGCAGPHPGYEAFSSEIIHEELLKINSKVWSLSTDEKMISRHFVCKDWKSAIEAVNAIAIVADREDIQHHPDLLITQYRNLTINIFTHAVGGLTKHDFNLAQEINKLHFQYSPKWAKENPEAIL